MSIYDKLLAVQTELKAPKGQYNSFGKYNYRSCEDILEAVKPLCKAHGALVMIADEVAYIDGRFYIKANVTFADTESGETLTVSAFAREPNQQSGMSDSQLTGTASSYARKYALNGLFCIDDTKDADTDAYAKQTGKAAQKPAEKPAEKPKPTPPPAIVKCKDCGKPITDVTWTNGKKTTAQKMVNSTIQKYGVPLCGDCYTLRKAKEQNGG